jgi:hypothetical protein
VTLSPGPVARWQLVSASARLGAWHAARCRTATPPVLSLPGPYVTAHCWSALATRTFPLGKFEQGFLDGHGPAQVRLGPPLSKKRPHCLRLSQQHLRFTQWVRERAIPLPPRCRKRVSSLYLPACPFRAPGDPIVIAPLGASERRHCRWCPSVGQEHKAHVGEALPPEPPVIRP